MADEYPQMLTANRLLDGAVVYLASSGEWSELFHEGALIRDAEEAHALNDAAGRAVALRLVVGPYLFAVRETEAGLEPASVREKIRAGRGPTFEVNAGSWTGRVAG